MNRVFNVIVPLLSILGFTLATEVVAAEPTNSVISVNGMHCAACSRKISNKLQEVTGVSAATADAKTGLVSITPKAQATLSPKALWEAVEAAGYKPMKIVGPSGTFTEKPKS